MGKYIRHITALCTTVSKFSIVLCRKTSRMNCWVNVYPNECRITNHQHLSPDMFSAKSRLKSTSCYIDSAVSLRRTKPRRKRPRHIFIAAGQPPHKAESRFQRFKPLHVLISSPRLKYHKSRYIFRRYEVYTRNTSTQYSYSCQRSATVISFQ